MALQSRKKKLYSGMEYMSWPQVNPEMYVLRNLQHYQKCMVQLCKFLGNFLNSGDFTDKALISGNFVLYKRIGTGLSKDIFMKFCLCDFYPFLMFFTMFSV